jgi:lysyl oxidase
MKAGPARTTPRWRMLATFVGVVVAMLALGSAAWAAVISNSSPISIPDSGTATPYPATINVSGLSGTTTDVNVTLLGVRHTWPDDVSALLVGPGGQKVMLMSEVGGGYDLNGVGLTFDDEAAGTLPDKSQISAGTYKPTQGTSADGSNARPASLPSPAPAGPYGTSLSSFDAADPNGTYSLYVFDDTINDSGAVAGGFSLDIKTTADGTTTPPGDPTTPPGDPTAPLYPDLKTLKPKDLRFSTATINGTTHRVMRFSNTAWNAGEGRLELRAKTVTTSSGKKTRVNQYVYDGAGGFTSKYVGDMVFHASHNHFHFEDFARYELWTRADYDKWVASNRAQGQAIKRGAKTTFCIMDTDLVQRLPNSPSNPVYSSCSTSVQGVSVGWGDTYGADLPDQWIDLGTSSLPDGQYALRSVADPSNKLYESANRSDTSREGQQENEAVTFFTVQGSTITIT